MINQKDALVFAARAAGDLSDLLATAMHMLGQTEERKAPNIHLDWENDAPPPMFQSRKHDYPKRVSLLDFKKLLARALNTADPMGEFKWAVDLADYLEADKTGDDILLTIEYPF